MFDHQGAEHLLRDLADHGLHQFHHALVIPVGLVGLEHRELGVVLAGEPLVAKVAADLEYLVHAAHQQALERKLQGDAEIEIAAQGVVEGLERLRRRAARDRLHHGRLDLDVAPFIEEVADLPDDLAAPEKHLLHLRICHQVEVALAVADLGVFEAVPFRRRRAQRLGEYGERFKLDARFVGLGAE